uniref:Tctex1 domain containing 2 n=1 Tax=Anser cygnoides TaxID=8845 RepID=A0A8B9ECW9_ANSCY
MLFFFFFFRSSRCNPHGGAHKYPEPLLDVFFPPPDRFKLSTVKECIHAILKEKLADAQYVPEEVPQLTKSLSEIIKDRLKEEGFDRYKMVVQVVIGEQRGEGVNMAARCFWDADTDSYAHDVFVNVMLCFFTCFAELLSRTTAGIQD